MTGQVKFSHEKIGFIGDLHGNSFAARYTLWVMHQKGIELVIQVGDFGIYSTAEGNSFADLVNELCEAYGITLIVVPGNHENWHLINELLPFGQRKEFAIYRKHVLIAPKAMRLEIGNLNFTLLGGAPSVDRSYRSSVDRQLDKTMPERKDRNWYWEETITGADIKAAIADGVTDVLVCHDAPSGIAALEDKLRGNPGKFHIADVLYAEQGRRDLREVFDSVAPRLLLHGHYHFPLETLVERPRGLGTTKVLGLAAEFDNYSMALMDTTTGAAQLLDARKLLNSYRALPAPLRLYSSE